MQIIKRVPASNYATSIPEVLVIIRDPASFVPLKIWFPAVQGTSTHAQLIALYQAMGGTAHINLACIIMQYAEDFSGKIIKRGIAPKLRAVNFLNGTVATYWSTGVPAVVLPNNVTLPTSIYIPANFHQIYELLDHVHHWMEMSHYDPELETQEMKEIQQTMLNCEILKRHVLTGETRLWCISPRWIEIEGRRRFRILFATFWIEYERFLNEMEMRTV